MRFWMIGSLTVCGALAAMACGDADVRLGRTALAQGDYGRAVSAFARAEARLGRTPDIAAGLGAAHRARADQLLTAGKCDAAREALLAAEQVSPPLLVDHQGLFECAAAQGAAPDVQVAYLKRLRALGDERISVVHTLFRLELALERHADALERVPALERHFALTLEDRRRLARVYESVGQSEAALTQLRALPRTERRHPLIRLKEAELLEKQGEVEPAHGILRSLTVEHPRNPVVFIRLADFLRRRGDGGAARAVQAHADALRGIEHAPRELRPLRKSRK